MSGSLLLNNKKEFFTLPHHQLNTFTQDWICIFLIKIIKFPFKKLIK